MTTLCLSGVASTSTRGAWRVVCGRRSYLTFILLGAVPEGKFYSYFKGPLVDLFILSRASLTSLVDLIFVFM